MQPYITTNNINRTLSQYKGLNLLMNSSNDKTMDMLKSQSSILDTIKEHMIELTKKPESDITTHIDKIQDEIKKVYTDIRPIIHDIITSPEFQSIVIALISSSVRELPIESTKITDSDMVTINNMITKRVESIKSIVKDVAASRTEIVNEILEQIKPMINTDEILNKAQLLMKKDSKQMTIINSKVHEFDEKINDLQKQISSMPSLFNTIETLLNEKIRVLDDSMKNTLTKISLNDETQINRINAHELMVSFKIEELKAKITEISQLTRPNVITNRSMSVSPSKPGLCKSSSVVKK